MPSAEVPDARWPCPCSVDDAFALLTDQVSLALAGDADAHRLLGAYVDHYLAVCARRRR